MTMEPESPDAIASRAGVEPGLPPVRSRTWSATAWSRCSVVTGSCCSLIPFVVGSYEAQLPRMDGEMAALFEAYFRDSQGMQAVPGPSVHRVLPVGEAIGNNVEIHPYEQAAALVESAKSWGVRQCICRTQQHLLGKGCDAPIENCMVFAPVEGAFDGSDVNRAITKEEALHILREAEEAGLVHSVSNHRSGQYYICNCCTCCCGVLRRVAEFDVPTAIARSAFLAVVDETLCIGCGACEERCKFGAIAVTGGMAVVDPMRCVGCGQCTLVCPVDAASLTRRPEDEILVPPLDEAAWRSRTNGTSTPVSLPQGVRTPWGRLKGLL